LRLLQFGNHLVKVRKFHLFIGGIFHIALAFLLQRLLLYVQDINILFGFVSWFCRRVLMPVQLIEFVTGFGLLFRP
jgi:hypothetical protein